MVPEVPLQLSLPAAGTGTMLPPSAAGTTQAPDADAEIVHRLRRPVPSASRPPPRRPHPRPHPTFAVAGAAGTLSAPDRGFFARVYAAVRAIPRGRVATYGQVAAMLGVPRGARAVGWALRALSAATRPPVPWHRVVGAGGRISLRGGSGPELQRKRLRAEGVAFRGAAVDMKRHACRSVPSTSGQSLTREASSQHLSRPLQGVAVHGVRERRVVHAPAVPLDRPLRLAAELGDLLRGKRLQRRRRHRVVDLAELAAQVVPVGAGGDGDQVLHLRIFRSGGSKGSPAGALTLRQLLEEAAQQLLDLSGRRRFGGGRRPRALPPAPTRRAPPPAAGSRPAT